MSLTGWAIGWKEGLAIREHPRGFRVAMKKKEPGTYFTQLGTEVPEEVAREAGFDVDRYRKDRLRRERVSEAMQAIETELAVEPTGKKSLLRRAASRPSISASGVIA
jgi:hypothetical protein